MLETEYCDPRSRKIFNVTFKTSAIEAGNGATKIVAVEFAIAGTCRGCDDVSPLFHDIDDELSFNFNEDNSAVDFGGDRHTFSSSPTLPRWNS